MFLRTQILPAEQLALLFLLHIILLQHNPGNKTTWGEYLKDFKLWHRTTISFPWPNALMAMEEEKMSQKHRYYGDVHIFIRLEESRSNRKKL